MYINVPENKQEEFHNQVKLAQAQLSSYKYPTTSEEYWWTIDNYWSYLLSIIQQFAPKVIELDGDILSIAVASTRLKEKRDVRLINFFHKTWMAAPDDGVIHAIPGWHILCDLCSEDYLAYEETKA